MRLVKSSEYIVGKRFAEICINIILNGHMCVVNRVVALFKILCCYTFMLPFKMKNKSKHSSSIIITHSKPVQFRRQLV